MSLPPAVQRQRDAANAAVAGIAPPAPEVVEPAPAPVTSVEPTHVQPPVERQQAAPDATALPAEPSAPAPEAQPDAFREVSTEQPGAGPLPNIVGIDLANANKSDLTAFIVRSNDRYSTLEGKYKAEVPRLIDQNKQLRDQIATLEHQIQSAPPTPNHGTPEQGATSRPEGQEATRIRQSKTYLKRLEEWGEEEAEEYLCDVLELRTPEPSPQTENLQQPIEPVAANSQSNESDQVDRAKDPTLVNGLRDAVDTFLGPGHMDAMVNHPQFLAWLDEFDVIAGSSRKQAMLAQLDAGQYVRAAHYWEQWAKASQFRLDAPADPRLEQVETLPSGTADAGLPDPMEGYVHLKDLEAHNNRQVRDSRYKASEECTEMQKKIDAAINSNKIIY